eukprot:scaffold13749_cov190-Skeletonema_marinoi.AAC.6
MVFVNSTRTHWHSVETPIFQPEEQKHQSNFRSSRVHKKAVTEQKPTNFRSNCLAHSKRTQRPRPFRVFTTLIDIPISDALLILLPFTCI